MLATKVLGLATATALIICAFPVGCTNNADTSDARNEGPPDASPDVKPDSHGDANATGDAPVLCEKGVLGADGVTCYDGTVGKTCTTDADCDVTGQGLAACTVTAGFTLGPLWPTPVCILKTCDPAPAGDTSGQFIHNCDGDDQDPSAHAVCVPTTTPTQSGKGVCYPMCQYQDDGQKPQGCQGKDVCNPFAFGESNSGPTGIGICFGGCTADADCPNNSKCQVDQAICVKTAAVRTKNVGDPCTQADSDNKVCNCVLNNQSQNGYCTKACISGTGSALACPNNYACDVSAFKSLGADGGSPGFTKQNDGLLGTCFESCSALDASTGCPTNAICKNDTVAGPDCLPQ
jgi:hypothetical protein